MTEKVKTLIDEYGESMKQACKGTGLFPSVCMAQFFLETGYGATVRKAANNLFGIKAGTKWTGKVMSCTTFEYMKDRTKKVYNGTGKVYNTKVEAIADNAHPYTLFRAYNTPKDSIIDRNRLLTNSSRYIPVLKAKTPEEQAEQLRICGYATGYNYGKILTKIILDYNLKQLD